MFKRKDYKEKQLRYSIRKVSFGAASVAIASLYLFMGSSAVSASEVQFVNGEQNTVTNKEEVKKNEKQTEATDIKKGETLDKPSLTKLIEEIDGKFTNGKYTSKTEDSVNQLKAALEAAKTALSTAKTQAELTQAHANLIVATTKLQTKALDKKEAPVVDTTNGKSTVGIKATNTEKASASNSIANSGSKDERNGKEMDKNNPLRTDTATTDTDPAANQTYTAPEADANLEKLSKKLRELPDYIENNKKVQDMDTLGDAKGVAAGSVAEINEFGGWKAVNQENGSAGKFAIAKKTEKGVFPIETVNVVGASKTAWIEEQSFNRDRKYMLFLSEVRTQATQNKESYESQPYHSSQNDAKGKIVAIGVKGYKGIEKSFKVYNSQEETKVNVQFKTGYSGIMEGDGEKSRAKYKVEVFSEVNGSESLVYATEFDPGVSVDDTMKTVVAAENGKPAKGSLNVTTADAALEELSQDKYKPLGTGGSFSSKDITLPKGANSYKVRISSANDRYLGMDYHSRFAQYALPITGQDFNINQDTGIIAKGLLKKIYDKLKATETADTDGKTNETKAAYLAELENINTLITSTDVKKTAEYKKALESTLSKQLALEVDKTGLTNSKASLDDLVKEDPTPGKTADSAKAYNDVKTEAQEAIEAAKTVIDNESATVAQVREALNKVNQKKTALEVAKQALVEAATAEEKAKLKADAAQLTKADETGKTPDSIAAYEAEYEKLKTQLEEAKAAAAAVEAKGDNATKDEVKAAQAKVDAVKTALDKAAELLVNKADKAELTKAKEALSGLTTEADPTTGKTADSAKAYNDAKTAAQEAIKEAEAVINDENATPEKVTEALNKVNEKKAALEKAKQALVEAATAEEKAKLKADAAQLTKADETGKTPDSIAAYEAEYEKLKTQLEEAKAAAAAVEAKGDNATKAEAQEAQAKVDAAKTALDKAAESLKNLDRDAAKKEIADAAKKATDTIEASTSLTPEQKAEEKAKVAKEAKDATDAIDNATTESGINSAKENGKLAIEKEAAISVINAEKAAKEQEIDNNTKLSDDEKAAAKAEVAKAATEAVEAIKNADTKDAVKAAKTNGEAAIKAVTPVGKEKALEAIQTAAEAKLAEIDKNDKLSAKEKAAAKAEVAKAAIEAVEAIQKATTQEAVNAAQVKGETAIKVVNPIGKEKALEAIQTAAEAKLAEIDKNTNLSAKEKAAAKAEVAKAAIEAVEAIQKAETQDAVDAAQVKGETAIKAVNPIGKEKALEAIQTTAEAKLAEIDKNTNLSAKEKAAAKAEVAKAAIEAVEAIQKVETQDAVDEAQAKGEATIKAVNPVEKEKALEAIKATKEAKLAEIDKNTSLSADEKAAAKAAVEKAYNEAVEAIKKADTQEAVNDAQAKGEAAIKAVNLIGKEKALEAIKATKEAKLAEIEKDTTLSAEDKAAAKAAIEKAYNEAVEAIKKAETQEEVNAAQLKGEAAIKAVNTIGKEDVNEAKEAVKAAAAEKIASIKANSNLSAEEKEKAIAEVERLKQAALDAIDKATTKAALDKALRTFLYQLDQESLVYERPTFNLEAYIQASITGVVKVELGKAITQAEVISRLNLPENVTVISVDLPDTNTLGRKFAKVILRLPDGTEATVFVPVEVVESSEEYNQQNRQPNNTPVKPQEDAKPAEVPSDNSEQPAVNQTEDVKGNSSTTSQESKASNQKVLPNTGTGNEISIFGSAAMTLLASLGLVATSKKKEEE